MPSFGFLSDLDLLLFGRLQLAIGLSLGAQALDRIHHVGLLRQHRIAEFLGPIEIVVHHGEYGRHRYQCLHARVPILIGERVVKLVALQGFVGLRPTIGLDHFERIGRRHEHLREQRIGIKRDRRHERVKLILAEGLLLRRCGFGASGLASGKGWPRHERGDAGPRPRAMHRFALTLASQPQPSGKKGNNRGHAAALRVFC